MTKLAFITYLYLFFLCRDPFSILLLSITDKKKELKYVEHFDMYNDTGKTTLSHTT